MKCFFMDSEAVAETVDENKVCRKIKAYADNMMMVEVFFENGGIGTMHKHFHDQTTYCLEGEFEFTVGSETRKIAAGDTIYMPPEVMHGCRLISEKGRLLDVFTPCRKDFLVQ